MRRASSGWPVWMLAALVCAGCASTPQPSAPREPVSAPHEPTAAPREPVAAPRGDTEGDVDQVAPVEDFSDWDEFIDHTPPEPPPAPPARVATLDGDAVRRAMRRSLWSFVACYRDVGANLEQLVKVAFTVTHSGQVIDAVVERSEVGDPAVGQCLIEQIRATHFPRADDARTVRVSWPFRYNVAGN